MGEVVLKVSDAPGEPAEMDHEEFAARASAGYVIVPGGPTCGNCEYMKDGYCVHPPAITKAGFLSRFGFKVRGSDDCCSFWAANDKVKKETKDFASDMREKIDEAVEDEENATSS